MAEALVDLAKIAVQSGDHGQAAGLLWMEVSST